MIENVQIMLGDAKYDGTFVNENGWIEVTYKLTKKSANAGTSADVIAEILLRELVQEDFRKQAASLRSAAASQRADILLGNFPAKLGRSYFEKHVSDLEQQADDLEEKAQISS